MLADIRVAPPVSETVGLEKPDSSGEHAGDDENGDFVHADPVLGANHHGPPTGRHTLTGDTRLA